MQLFFFAVAVTMVQSLRMHGAPTSADGALLAEALRSGYAVFELPSVVAHAANDVIAMQDHANCALGEEEHANVMDSNLSAWRAPPCWPQGQGPHSVVRLFHLMRDVVHWVLRAAGAHAPSGSDWLPEALEECARKRVLVRSFAYRPAAGFDLENELGTDDTEHQWLSYDGTTHFMNLGGWRCDVYEITSFRADYQGIPGGVPVQCNISVSIDGASWQQVLHIKMPRQSGRREFFMAPVLPRARYLRASFEEWPDGFLTRPLGRCVGLAAPQGYKWGHTHPHQDASYVTILLDSARGLHIKPHRDHPWERPAVGPGRAMALVGARLAAVSQGFYPAPCHAVEVPERLRLSWAFISPTNVCLYKDVGPTWPLDSCALSWRPGFAIPHMPEDCDHSNPTRVGGGYGGGASKKLATDMDLRALSATP